MVNNNDQKMEPYRIPEHTTSILTLCNFPVKYEGEVYVPLYPFHSMLVAHTRAHDL